MVVCAPGITVRARYSRQTGKKKDKVVVKEIKKFPLLRRFVFYHIHFEVKENEWEQRLMGG